MNVKQFLQENSSSIGSSGAEWDDCSALTQLNRARSLLYSLGDWDGLTVYSCISQCATGKLITPWFASEIKAAYTCKGKVTIATGEYFSIVSKSCCGKRLGITDTQTYSPTPVDIGEQCRGISLMSGDMDDEKQTISIVYMNRRGSIITDQFEITDAFKKHRTSSSIKQIISISKPATSGEIHFYSNDKGCPYLFSLSPYESSPRYRVYCLNNNECGSCCGGNIVLKLRKKYVPYTDKHYDHLIDLNPYALSLGMQAISAMDQRTVEGFNLHNSLVRNAVDFLKKEQLEKSSFSSDTETTTMNIVAVPGTGFNMKY